MSSRCLFFEEYTDSDYDTAKLNHVTVRCQEIEARIALIVDSDSFLSKKNEYIKNGVVDIITLCISIAQVMKCTVIVTLDDKAVMVTLSFASVFMMELAETRQFSLVCEKASGITIIPAAEDYDRAMIIFQFDISEHVENDG